VGEWEDGELVEVAAMSVTVIIQAAVMALLMALEGICYFHDKRLAIGRPDWRRMALPHGEMEKGARSPFLTWIFLPDGVMNRLDSLRLWLGIKNARVGSEGRTR
jgi:hypothetical protein